MVTPSKMQAAIGVPPSGASPEGLRDMNVGRMRILLSRQKRIMQGEVAVPCARGKNTAGLSTILLLPLAGGRVRAYVVREFGEIDCEPLRSPAGSCESIFGSTPCPIGRFKRKAPHRRGLSREEALLLRRFKNVLNTLKPVEELLQRRGTRETSEGWTGVLPRLP